MKALDKFSVWLNKKSQWVEEIEVYSNRRKMADLFGFLVISIGIPSFLITMFFASHKTIGIWVEGNNILPTLLFGLWFIPICVFGYLYIYFSTNTSKLVGRTKQSRD